MEVDKPRQSGADDLVRGLPMVAKWDPEALAEEKQNLAELADKPFGRRVKGYWAKLGPGWMQSALTLGSGSAAASLFAGAYLGYSLLWLQPVAMLLGVIMLSAVAYQTLATNARPLDALNKHVHPAVGWSWAIASLAATVIWHFPQYALAGGMGQDMIKAVAGSDLGVKPIHIGLIILVLCTWITWSYGSSARGVRIYERLIKYMVWLIIGSFVLVIAAQTVRGRIEWGKVLLGVVRFRIPASNDPRGVSVLMAGFSAAVGINMTFLFPYTLLARGWGKEHQGLARFDLFSGMLVPFAIVTTLMIVATASTIHGTEYVPAQGRFMSPVNAAHVFEPVIGLFFARVVFAVGILGMALSSITLHMLVSAFAFCEIFKLEPTGWRYKVGSLIPAVGVLGTVYWNQLQMWIAIPTSAVCGLLLPIAYIGFFILNNKKSYLGDAKPKGKIAWLWNTAMLIAICASISSSSYWIYSNWGEITGYCEKIAKTAGILNPAGS